MNTIESFVNIGNISVEIFKSDNKYCFYIQPSSEEVSCITDVIEDTLKLY